MKNLKRYSQLFESQQELTQEQSEWLDKCTKGTWEVNPKTGLVDIKGDFICIGQNLTDFKGVRFGHVSEGFSCYGNKLKSLEGAPRSVRWNFSCSFNDLTSLEGAPQSVDGNFNCSHNELESLKGLPDGFSVGGGFTCSHNELKSLEGLPDGFKVDGGFTCSHNELKSLKGLPDGFKVDGGFTCSHNELESLEGAPQIVDEKIHCSDNPISERAIRGVLKRMGDKKISLEQAVAEYWESIPEDTARYFAWEVDKIYLAKHHPSLPEEEKRIYRAMELNMKRR